MIRIAVVGYGNIGRAAVEAAQAAGDVEPVCIVRRSSDVKELMGVRVVADIGELDVKPDVAVLCTPTRSVPEQAKKYLSMGVCTVDSFDIHTDVWELKCELDAVAREHGAVSVVSAGWDPGSDSIVRALLEAAAPRGITYTNFGPGMSMGHTVAVKSKEGVRKALSMTIPVGTGIHRRMVYIELEDGADYDAVAASIRSDPYFAHDETHIIAVDSVDALLDMGHGVKLVRKGVSGTTQSQRFEFDMQINNPALTGQIMISAARAAVRQRPGCYTMIELPVIDMLEGNRETLVRRLV